MIVHLQRVRAGLATGLLLASLSLVEAGCHVPWAAGAPQGEAVLRSPACHCRFAYPASWYLSASNGDPGKPILGLSNYDDSGESTAPVPRTFTNIGIDWQSDPIGQLYLVATTHRFSPWPGHRLTVSGWPATSYAHWTAPPSRGGIYVEHVYVFIPWYQRDYDIWLQAANPPGGGVSSAHRVFDRVLRSLTIVLPNSVP